ncbi:hypothetical protein [Mesorhizobium sp.]|uniref:hypothetical protein n=1 Tax=Mesorhizobium sp. TaxID=1871066 RepID=UPI000FEA5092|nr:hypothetical protein [Mesorhizobium sp.]RWE64269.1 MAG: hypothetical protein EOS62_30135 [Mesorhizobium sp.]
MTDTLEDVMREEFYERLTKEIIDDNRESIIGEFALERSRSYYLSNPDLDIVALDVLEEAEKLLSVSPSASIIFSYSCIEMTIRDVLLKPIAYGLVHDEKFSELVAELVVGNRHLHKLLFHILEEAGHIDLKLLHRWKTAKKNIWAEKEDVWQLRDEIVHRGAKATDESAKVAFELASFLIKRLFPGIQRYYLTLDR